MQQIYTIRVVSQLTGISIHTLRAWERRYQVVVPERDKSGQRFYNEEELEKLELMAELTRLGFTIRNLAHQKIADLKKVLKKHTGQDLGKCKNLLEKSKTPLEQQENVDDLKINFYILKMALKKYDLAVISDEIYKLSKLLGPKDFAFKVIIPLLKIMGEMMDRGEIGISQEHALSALLRFHMGPLIYGRQGMKKKRTKTLALATPSKELHEFGILVSALLAKYYGYNFYYLGVNLPAESLIETIHAINADQILMGISYKTSKKEFHTNDQYFQEVLNSLNKKQQLIVGGPPSFDLQKFNKEKKFLYLQNFNDLEDLLKNQN